MGNIALDAKQARKASKSAGSDVVKSEELGVEDEKEFEEFSKRMKEEASKQIPEPEYPKVDDNG